MQTVDIHPITLGIKNNKNANEEVQKNLLLTTKTNIIFVMATILTIDIISLVRWAIT